MVSDTRQHPLHLDGLFGHLSVSQGLYSRETLCNLFSCIVRLIRQYRLKGLVFERLLGDVDFRTLAVALENQPDLTIFPVSDAAIHRGATLNPETQGFFIALTNQFCATLFWSTAPQEAYGMLEGGWTFHPGDCKTMALQLAPFLVEDIPGIQDLIEATPLDRRYDEKTTGFITQLVNNLESRNRDLSMALNQVKTLNARVLDQERLAAIGQLCSVIAHEIRNPLGLIDLYAKLIEAQVEKLSGVEGHETLTANLKLIRSASANLEGILSELTQYARPLSLELETVDLRLVIAEVVDMFSPRYAEKDVALEWQPPTEAVWVSVDHRRIQQALINLVKNALEASSSKTKVRLVLTARANDDRIFVKVQDQGGGVSETSQKKLFTPYFSTKGNGTGLGLAHSRKILQAHGGTVALLSTSEHGSLFALILPRDVQVAPAPGDALCS